MKFAILIIGISMFLYAILVSYFSNKVTSTVRTNIRRFYYSLWLLGTALWLYKTDEKVIQHLGKNALSFAPELWVFLCSLILGFLLELLIISASEFKLLNLFGNAVFEKPIEEAAENLNKFTDLTDELTKKIISFYKCYSDLLTVQ